MGRGINLDVIKCFGKSWLGISELGYHCIEKLGIGKSGYSCLKGTWARIDQFLDLTLGFHSLQLCGVDELVILEFLIQYCFCSYLGCEALLGCC